MKVADDRCPFCGLVYIECWCDAGQDAEDCERCGGDGFVGYLDSPDTWGEDCPSEGDHLVTCPTCRGTGRDVPPPVASPRCLPTPKVEEQP